MKDWNFSQLKGVKMDCNNFVLAFLTWNSSFGRKSEIYLLHVGPRYFLLQYIEGEKA